MSNSVYETHRMDDPLLPFIYHRRFDVTQRHSAPNWHTNIEILYCIHGVGQIQCGSELHSFAVGDLFVVNADTPHSICSEGSVSYRCLIIDNRFFRENGFHIETLHFQNAIRDPETVRLFESVVEAFHCFDAQNICAVADIRYAVLGFLRALCGKHTAVKPKDTGSANTRIKDAITYIRQNLSRSLSLEDIANHVGISKFHLSREFKVFTGKTIVQTANLIRCTEAKRLIEGGMGVSAAATACGYENLSYFTRTFKKYFRILPSTLAKKRPDAP